MIGPAFWIGSVIAGAMWAAVAVVFAQLVRALYRAYRLRPVRWIYRAENGPRWYR